MQMKELKCNKCNVYLGEMEKGKLKKGSIILCTECYDIYKTYESLVNLKHGDGNGDSKPIDMPDFMKGLFK